jgi:hypothetical protein
MTPFIMREFGMGQEWYIAQNGQRVGPISEAELRQQATAGKVQPTDLIWKQGMEKWVPARSVKGLFAPVSVPAAAAPPPLPPQSASPSPDGATAAAPAAASKPGLRVQIKERLQSPETKALAQKAKSKWQGASNPAKIGIAGGNGSRPGEQRRRSLV